MNPEILKIIREKGLLLEKDIFDLLNGFEDVGAARDFLEGLEKFSGQKIITKSTITKNFEYVQNIVNKLPGQNKEVLEKIFIRLGISVEIRKEKELVGISGKKESFQVFCADTSATKKIEVGDFVGNFRSRYQQIQKILMGRPEIQQNLVSIGKISNNRQSLSIIGMVVEKRTTKNGNVIIKFEDLTGEISGVVKSQNEELFKKAGELMLDDIVGIRASGNRDLLFIYDLFYPDSFIHDKVKFDEDMSIAFVSDIHCGSVMHLGKCFERFVEWLNSEDENAKKIKYLFIVGDTVDGVGIYPGQESFLALKSLKEQYALLASYLKKVPKRITIFHSPGNHDAARVAQPQPPASKEYAAPLYELENIVMVTNPTMIKLFEGDKEFKVLLYHGGSAHCFINSIPELREMKAHRSPAKAVKHMLKRRHLDPMHSSAIYIPNISKDPLVITEVPDLMAIGEVHRVDVENYNGTLIITSGCWQSKTPFEEKVGNEPDPAKVPVFNLKTRELKIFDFNEPIEAAARDEGKEMEKGIGLLEVKR